MTVLERPRVVLAPVAARTGWTVPVLLALGAGLLRLPFVGMPLAPDEGGYLLVASQWSPGTSTYGDYFVDRPPLLMAIFWLADLLGGGTALRLLGVAAVVASVLIAGRLGGRWTALAAAVFLSTPIFGTTRVDGELLAVPFVLAGVLLVLRPGRSAALGAGVCAAAAVLVKQNMVDVIVFALVLLLAQGIRGSWGEVAGRAGRFVLGGGSTLVVALVVAWTRGTSPSALWDSLVVFRAQAATVINASAISTTPERFHLLLVCLAVSGAPLVVAASLATGRRSTGGVDLRWPAAAMLAWELAGAALGGSYWLHYLVAVVPGVVVLVSATVPADVERRISRWARRAIGVATVSTVACLLGLLVHPPVPGSDQAVSAYVRAHSAPGDTMVVAFGAPNIVHDAGLSSPYPHLWSLSVRVRDPDLTALTDVLQGSEPPRWVVVAGTSLATWGVDASRSEPVLEQHYREVTVAGDWHVFERR